MIQRFNATQKQTQRESNIVKLRNQTVLPITIYREMGYGSMSNIEPPISNVQVAIHRSGVKH